VPGELGVEGIGTGLLVGVETGTLPGVVGVVGTGAAGVAGMEGYPGFWAMGPVVGLEGTFVTGYPGAAG